MTDHTIAPHPIPVMILSLLEERLPGGGKSLVPLVRQMGGRRLTGATGTGAFLRLHGRAPLDHASDSEWCGASDIILLLVLATCLIRNTACSTLEKVTRRLVGPFRSRRPGRRAAAAATPTRHGRSLRQWLCAASRNEKDCRPSIFVHLSHNPPPIRFSPASG